MAVQVPSEVHPLETRSTGQAVTVFTNFVASFIIGQFFNSMLCRMQVRPPASVPAGCRDQSVHVAPNQWRAHQPCIFSCCFERLLAI